MKVSLVKMFLLSYAFLSIVVLITYSSGLNDTTREWEPVNLPLSNQCRAIGESIPLDTSGIYKVEFTPGGEVVTANGTLKEPGEVHITLRGVYFEYFGSPNTKVYVRIEPEHDWRGIAEVLLVGLIGGGAVAAAFRGLGFE